MINTEKYKIATKFLQKLNQNKIIPGLERIRTLMNLLGNPQNELEIITVGGTNAKGSTCYSLSKTLMQTGGNIGCFTSPHLHSVRERIKINNQNIDPNTFGEYILKIKELANDNNIQITYFEMLTAVAYLYFKEEKVDYAIMEIGLGGEWDAVNVGNAQIAILTTLGQDHTEYLGHNLEDIAKTKAKIVRKDSIVITGWDEKYHKYIPQSSKLIKGNSIEEWITNCVKCLNLSIVTQMCSVPGRLERYTNFTLDTAHNVQAIKHILENENNYQKIILGMLQDKDIENFICELPNNSVILGCDLNTERSTSSENIANLCRKANLSCKKFESVEKAIKSIKNENTLITGSFYTVSEARTHFKLEGYSEL